MLNYNLQLFINSSIYSFKSLYFFFSAICITLPKLIVLLSLQISLIVLVLGMIVFRIKVTWHIFEAIIPLVLLFLLVLGVGMILSTIAVFFRDMEYLWSVILMLIMYASAIFYDAHKIFKIIEIYKTILDVSSFFLVKNK